MTPQQIAELLERGAADDIWYAAEDYGETDTAAWIECVQQAMIYAARILRSLPHEVT